MSRVWRDDPPPRARSGPDYGDHADLTKVLNALRSDNPVAALHHVYPWMLDVDADGWLRSRIAFVNSAIPLDNAGQHDELQVLAERFIHAAMTARPDGPAVRRWTLAELLILAAAFLLAALLIGGAVITRNG